MDIELEASVALFYLQKASEGERRKMKRQKLMADMEKKDLIALKNLGEKVHIVWSDSKSYKRICRPSMIEVGTYSRDKREWEILGKCSDFKNYVEDVKKLGREHCGHCLAWSPKIG
jgi:hypothetical protein